MNSYLDPKLVWVVLAKLTNTDNSVASKCVGRGRNLMRNPSGSEFCSGSAGEDQQNFLHGKGPISCHELPWLFVPGPPSQSIVSWAGESWSWPFVGSLPGTTHHFFFFWFIWTLRCIEHLGLWHTGWRTQQNKDLNAARWYTVLPDRLLLSTIAFYMRVHIYIYLFGGGSGWPFVSKGWSKW